MLKRIGYSMREIMKMEVLSAVDQIMFYRTDEMLWQAELLGANGINVFDRQKGIKRYIDFFDEVERFNRAKAKYEDPVEPVRIDPVNNFMEG